MIPFSLFLCLQFGCYNAATKALLARKQAQYCNSTTCITNKRHCASQTPPQTLQTPTMPAAATSRQSSLPAIATIDSNDTSSGGVNNITGNGSDVEGTTRQQRGGSMAHITPRQQHGIIAGDQTPPPPPPPPQVLVALNAGELALCGGLGGACGTLLSMPCDVARTRIVAQSTGKVRLRQDRLR